MNTWLAWKILVSSIILIGGTESCTTIYNRPFAEVMEPNKRSPWLVFIAHKSGETFPGIKGVSYGSLIRDDLVLTGAFKVSSVPQKRLKVVLDCDPTGEITCDSRLVNFKLHSSNFDEDQVKPSDWMILILKSPFKIQDSGVISLAGKNHQWDPQDCLIYHWMFVRVLNDKIRKTFDEGFVHKEFRVTLGPESSRIYPEDEPKLLDYVDCFIGKCNKNIHTSTQVHKLSFVGSPIVCKLLDQDQYVQVGFTNFVFEAVQHYLDDHIEYENNINYDQDTFVDLTKDFDEFIIPTVLKN
ncbi:uncharacterized protein LOC123263581 [Cotesia glomerata]|uniref:Uncharacterized protein n=1 Tax=Cotesia glomerata TaxID=32391 RepID=A0AAV7IQM2_COTGL|nr:uncharacterized protein LOC123263581 [Cotesia glomerata]KAH0554554.1 hypothetical protein KQX54_011319 [Cotesia glomerata]